MSSTQPKILFWPRGEKGDLPPCRTTVSRELICNHQRGGVDLFNVVLKEILETNRRLFSQPYLHLKALVVKGAE